MRLLILGFGLPCPPDRGRRIRMYHLYGPLARRHELWWASSRLGGDVQATARMFHHLQIVASSVPNHPVTGLGKLSRGVGLVARACTGDYFQPRKEMTSAVAGLLESDFDAVVAESEAMASYVRLAKPGIPWILSTQNMPSVIERRLWQTAKGPRARLAAWLGYRASLRFERSLFPRFSAVTAVSDLERDMLVRRFEGIRAYTVPNGVDSRFLLWNTPPATGEHVLNFTGHFDYPPNWDAMRDFCTNILPTILERDRAVRLELVGKSSDAFAASLPPGLPVTGLGYVDDVLPYFSRASAVVAPLRVGGGTRIKILEAIALGKPVVATSVGAEGLDLDASCGLLTADEPRDFAEKTLRAINDPIIRDSARKAGREKVRAEYTWESSARKLEEVIDLTVLENRARQGSR